MNRLIPAGLLTAVCLLALPLIAAAQEEMPDAFHTLLVAETSYGAAGEPELIDMPLSYCNEFDPALVANPVCNGFLAWDGIAFSTAIEYTAEDLYGSWEATYSIDGLLSTENFVSMDGLDVPYLDVVNVFAEVFWVSDDGLSNSESWYYTIYNVPPVPAPQGGAYTAYFGEPPFDSLAYSIRLDSAEAVQARFGELYNGIGMFDDYDPDQDYFRELWLEEIIAAEFDMVLFYSSDIVAVAGV